MDLKKGLPPSFRGILLILFSLAALSLGPTIFRKKIFPVLHGSPESVAAIRDGIFPLDVVLISVFPLKNSPSPFQKDPPINLRKLASQYRSGILVNFWATWCPPCIEELPSFETLNRQLVKKNSPQLPGLVAISVDEKISDVTSFIRSLDYGISFLVLHDPDGSLSRSVGTTKFPETYWLTPEGKIRHKWIGPQNWLAAETLAVLQRKGP